MPHSIPVTANLATDSVQSYRDWLGIGASVLCAIHCAAMPFVVGFLPLLGLSFLADPSFHKWMVGVCLVLALLAFVPGWRRHHQSAPAVIGLIGLSLISFAAFAGPDECCPTPCAEPASGNTMLVSSVTPVAADEACAESCCADSAGGEVSPSQQPMSSSDSEGTTECAATCCASEPARIATAEDVPCTSECCPTGDDTLLTANSGDFMRYVWLLMTPLGGIILVGAHLTNHRLGCRCKAGCCSVG